LHQNLSGGGSLLAALRPMEKDALTGRTVENPVSLQYIIEMLRGNAHETALANTVDNTNNCLAVSPGAKHVILS